MNKNSEPTTKEDLTPPTIKPAPITKIKVETTGIPKYAVFIGTNTFVIRNTLKLFK